MSTTYINIVWNTDSTPSYSGDCTSQGLLVLPEKTALIVVTLTAASGEPASIDSFSVSPLSPGVQEVWEVINVPGAAIGVGIMAVDFASAPGGQLSFGLNATIGGRSQPISDPTVINVDPPTTVVWGDAGARGQEELPANVHRVA
jgi:hypothetical protein